MTLSYTRNVFLSWNPASNKSRAFAYSNTKYKNQDSGVVTFDETIRVSPLLMEPHVCWIHPNTKLALDSLSSFYFLINCEEIPSSTSRTSFRTVFCECEVSPVLPLCRRPPVVGHRLECRLYSTLPPARRVDLSNVFAHYLAT